MRPLLYNDAKCSISQWWHEFVITTYRFPSVSWLQEKHTVLTTASGPITRCGIVSSLPAASLPNELQSVIVDLLQSLSVHDYTNINQSQTEILHRRICWYYLPCLIFLISVHNSSALNPIQRMHHRERDGASGIYSCLSLKDNVIAFHIKIASSPLYPPLFSAAISLLFTKA